MNMPVDQYQEQIGQAWDTYLVALDQSLTMLETNINEARDMATICTDEWCRATEHVIDDLNNSIFSIHEPRWASPEQSNELKRLKRRVYDLYVNYRGVYEKLS
jgi:hypothetical protein